MSFIIIQELSDDEDLRTTTSKNRSRTNSTPIPKYFPGDVICRLTRKNQEVTRADFGVVVSSLLESRHLQDFEFSSDDISNKIQIQWASLQQSADLPKMGNVLENGIFLFERPFSIGSKVKREKLTSGKVIATEKLATVRILGTDKVILNVPLTRLKKLKHKAISLGSYIVQSEWIGVVTAIEKSASFEILRTSDSNNCFYTWVEDKEMLFKPEQSSNALQSKIKYPGQILKLSAADLHQLTFENNDLINRICQLFSPASSYSATISKIECIYTVKWLDCLPQRFHDLTPMPSTKIHSNDSNNFVVLNELYQSNDFPIGSLHTVNYFGENTWEIQNYKEWMQSLNETQQGSYPNHNSNVHNNMEIDDEISENGDSKIKNTGSSALQIWSALKSCNVENEYYGKTLPVEVVCTQSWVTVQWPNYFKHIEYFSSCQFEPSNLKELPNFQVGTFVRFNTKSGNPLSWENYYGIVMRNDCAKFEIGAPMRINWFKCSPDGAKPIYVGNTKSSMADIDLHPDFHIFTEGSIVYWEDFDNCPNYRTSNIGVVQNALANGMIKVKTPSEELQCWPECLKKLQWIGFYNAVEGKWTQIKGNFQHLKIRNNYLLNITTSGNNNILAMNYGDNYKVSRFEKNKNETQDGELEILDEIPNFFKFSDLPVVEVDENLFSGILKDLKVFGGDDRPEIWFKSFAFRKDLFSVAIEGPANTLYEDILFFFNVKIPDEFPNSPPLFHFYSFSSQEINPCLKTNGKVLLPLLNTFQSLPGFYSERWDSEESSIGLVLACIQKLILCELPYRNHSNFEILKLFSSSLTSKIVLEKNFSFLLEIVDSVRTQLESPLELWRGEMYRHYCLHIPKFLHRIKSWLDPNTPSRILPQLSSERKEVLLRRLHYLQEVYSQSF